MFASGPKSRKHCYDVLLEDQRHIHAPQAAGFIVLRTSAGEKAGKLYITVRSQINATQ